MDPRCTRKFEILCEPSSEFNAFRRIIGICEPPRVAHFVEAFFVKGCRCEIGPFPVSGRHIGSSYPQLAFSSCIDRNHLQLVTRARQSHNTRAQRLEMNDRNLWCSFRGSPSCSHAYTLAGFQDGETFQAVPQMYRQCSCGIQNDLQTCKEASPELRVVF